MKHIRRLGSLNKSLVNVNQSRSCRITIGIRAGFLVKVNHLRIDQEFMNFAPPISHIKWQSTVRPAMFNGVSLWLVESTRGGIHSSG